MCDAEGLFIDVMDGVSGFTDRDFLVLPKEELVTIGKYFLGHANRVVS